MPFLRVIRDKRGYETTYLMHWYRDGARQRSRILYVFRTPGGVRVGRESLGPEILRDLEANYPDIAFDWKSVFDNRQIIETGPEMRRPRKRRHSDEDTAASTAVTASSGPVVRPEETVATPPPRPPIPSGLEGATPDEQTAFLARWYPIIRERVPQRTTDPMRREALLALAERLNPAAWTDADQIVAGLQHAAEALERLSRVFARRRRRARRAKGADKNGARAAVAPSPATDTSSSSE